MAAPATEQRSAVAALGRGQALRWPDSAPERIELEAPLGPVTDQLRADAGRGKGLAGVALDAAIERAEHVFLSHRGLKVHFEVHDAGPDSPVLVVHHGLGDHARRFTPLAARLHDDGWSSVLVDRPGHGLSEGRRGHCPLGWALELIDLSARYGRQRFGGKLALLGDSLGGITAWYALTREPDIDAAICHCIGHPGVHHEPAMAWKGPLMRTLGTLMPYGTIPVRQIADYENVALEPSTQAFFDAEHDIAFNFGVSAGSVASYLGFRPARSWSDVELPVRVEIGAEDRMVTAEFTRRCFDRAHPERASLEEIPGAGHQLYLDHLDVSYPGLIAWLEQELG